VICILLYGPTYNFVLRPPLPWMESAGDSAGLGDSAVEQRVRAGNQKPGEWEGEDPGR
jgi:hypothetical protein